MQTINTETLLEDYRRNGVVVVPSFLSPDEVVIVRSEIERYIAEDLSVQPQDAATMEADGKSVRNLWRLEKYNEFFLKIGQRKDILEFIAPFVNGTPVLAAVETFNKPAKVGSGVPYHQDNAYFCRTPPDMLTIWIAIDPVTTENGPVYFIPGSHSDGVFPTKPSGVRGNSMGMANPPDVPDSKKIVGILKPGDATIHHCNTIHHSAPNTTDKPRLALLLVYHGEHVQTDEALKAAYQKAATQTPP